MSFLELFENIEDKRTDINKHYDLLDIIFLTMSAVLSGAKGWKAIHIFGVAQLEWLMESSLLANGRTNEGFALQFLPEIGSL